MSSKYNIQASQLVKTLSQDQRRIEQLTKAQSLILASTRFRWLSFLTSDGGSNGNFARFMPSYLKQCASNRNHIKPYASASNADQS